MNRIICILFLAGLTAGGRFAYALEPDRVMLLQDEIFFLQDENQKLKQELADKDEAVRKMFLEKEDLERKVDGLQKAILAREADLPKKMEQAALPYRVQMEEALDDLKVLSMAVEEKNARLTGVLKEKETLLSQIDMLTGEKISLRASLRRVSDELEELKAKLAGRIADEAAAAEARVNDIQARLNAERLLVDEKIAAARKPLEDKLSLLQQESAEKIRQLEAASAEALRKFEDQFTALRANAAREEKRLKEQIEACRQPGVKK